MRKPNKSTTLFLIILSLVFLCANQSSNAQSRGKSYTKPAKSTSTPSTKSSSAGEKDADQTEMDKMVMAIRDGDIVKVKNIITDMTPIFRTTFKVILD